MKRKRIRGSFVYVWKGGNAHYLWNLSNRKKEGTPTKCPERGILTPPTLRQSRWGGKLVGASPAEKKQSLPNKEKKNKLCGGKEEWECSGGMKGASFLLGRVSQKPLTSKGVIGGKD